MTTALWIVAVAMIIVGLAGVVLPALPGLVFIFGGVVLAAWIDDFARIPGWVVGILAVLTLVGFAVDYLATLLSARRAGASRQGLIGAALGTLAGVFTGLWGLLFMPLLGAAAGEYLAQKDALRAGKVGLATWIGLLVGTAVKIAIAFTMVGVAVTAFLI